MRAASAPAALALVLLMQHPGLVGSWRGTSLCADKVHWPACHDEQVIYDARPSPTSSDSVLLRADKIVNGVRDFMAEMTFGPAPDGSWIAEFKAGQTNVRVVLTIAGTHLRGTLVDVPSGRTVRNLALERVQSEAP